MKHAHPSQISPPLSAGSLHLCYKQLFSSLDESKQLPKTKTLHPELQTVCINKAPVVNTYNSAL